MQLSEEARMIRDAVAAFAANDLLPDAAERDHAGRLDRSLLVSMAEIGLFGVHLPEEEGGVGAGALALALVQEEIAARCPSTALAALAHGVLAVETVRSLANKEERSALLPSLLSGELLATLATGGDVRALPSGSGWRLSGKIDLVPALAVADRVLVRATVPEGPRIFVLSLPCEGARVETGPPPLGMRAAGLADLVLADAPAGARLSGGAGEDVPLLGRFGLAALSVGIARGACECGRDYAKARVQFGRPLATLGAIRAYLAEMAATLEGARRLVHHAAAVLDAGSDARLEVALARFSAAEAAVRVSDRAVQIHGGYGYVAEFAAERFYRDAQVPRSLLGTDDEERARIADAVLA